MVDCEKDRLLDQSYVQSLLEENKAKSATIEFLTPSLKETHATTLGQLIYDLAELTAEFQLRDDKDKSVAKKPRIKLNMASRNRSRNGPTREGPGDATEEEHALWAEIHPRLERLKELEDRVKFVADEIDEMNKTMGPSKSSLSSYLETRKLHFSL
jgi:hypothetical protein